MTLSSTTNTFNLGISVSTLPNLASKFIPRPSTEIFGDNVTGECEVDVLGRLVDISSRVGNVTVRRGPIIGEIFSLSEDLVVAFEINGVDGVDTDGVND